jgi:peptidoglycan/LPS O-acetylase OafA/YrhL
MVTLALALLWHFGTSDLWGIGSLPARLFEFYCGIVAAYLVVAGRPVSRLLLIGGIAVPLALIFLPGSNAAQMGVEQPLWGVTFASAVLLGYQSNVIARAFSWRPLVLLGIASYSVYLVHEPFIKGLIRLSPMSLAASPVMVPLALGFSLAVGVAFHIVVERPCMSRAVMMRALPPLRRVFGWTEYPWRVTRTRPTPSTVEA